MITFKEKNDSNQKIFFECKNYSDRIKWQEFQDKILQLDASSYLPTAFVGLSPHFDISNINCNTLENLEKTVKFPFEIWSPNSNIRKYFGLYPDIYKKIYGEYPNFKIDRKQILNFLKKKISSWIEIHNQTHAKIVNNRYLPAISSLITFSNTHYAIKKWSKAFRPYFGKGIDLEKIGSSEVIDKIFRETEFEDYGNILKTVKRMYPNISGGDLRDLKQIFEMFGFNYDEL